MHSKIICRYIFRVLIQASFHKGWKIVELGCSQEKLTTANNLRQTLKERQLPGSQIWKTHFCNKTLKIIEKESEGASKTKKIRGWFKQREPFSN